MKQEIEIEFKMLLTEEEFNRLLTSLSFPDQALAQTNHYFETEDFLLKEHNSALRIRERNDTYTLTLKQPKEEGILETHESLSKNQALSWINGIDRSSSPYINDTLKQENISINDLVYFGSLRTERYQFKDETITYVLDKSTYNYTTDYELEIEATNYDDGKRVFQSLLKTHKIVEKKTVTKIERFFTTR